MFVLPHIPFFLQTVGNPKGAENEVDVLYRNNLVVNKKKHCVVLSNTKDFLHVSNRNDNIHNCREVNTRFENYRTNNQ